MRVRPAEAIEDWSVEEESRKGETPHPNSLPQGEREQERALFVRCPL